MSRAVTPASGAVGPSAADSQPASYIAQDHAGANHSHQAPEYLTTNEAGHQDATDLQRSGSQMSQSATYIPSRGGTLKKKASLSKTGSLKRSGSRKSSYAGSVRSMKLGEKERYEPAEFNSAFYCPVPTTSSPTEILANRFQAWRRVLKDLINYFRDLHKSYETRSKTLYSASNVINNITMPTDFLSSGGIADAAEILRDFHKQAITEAGKARDLENEVIMQLTGLRSDLSQKIKEIKNLSGDFKNSVHKEQDVTRRAVNALQEALGVVDRDAAAAAGKGDPFLMKMGVERQLERQIEEENYLHRAFLNLEASGRELESIVVGEIQKAYNVLAGILKRDADSNYDVAEKLREGPLGMTRDHEWDAFTTNNPNMVDPRQPLRQVKNITYEGKNHPAAIEVKSGMLERKSKYLKNYTPGWYILSPTHLHEFKSADQIPFQQPVMSLYLPEQKLGSHSEPGSSSHKFMLKGRQTGSMHRGHTWIFRAETHDTMMAWFSDIRELTEKKGEARNEFVRRTHARSASAGSSHRAASIGSGDSQMDEDDADRVAFSGEQSVRGVPLDQGHDGASYTAGSVISAPLGDDTRSEAGWRPQRPQPGGRFPSDVNVTRGLQAPLSPSSGDSGDEHDREAIAAASALPGTTVPVVAAATNKHTHIDHQPAAKNKETKAVDAHNQKAAGNSVHEPTRATTTTGAGNTTSGPVQSATNTSAYAFGDFRAGPGARTVSSSTESAQSTIGTESGYTADKPAQANTNAPSAYAFGDFRAAPSAAAVHAAPEPIQATTDTGYTAGEHARVVANPTGAEVAPDTQSQYHEWVGAGLAGAGAGALGATAAQRHSDQSKSTENRNEEKSIISPATSGVGQPSAPAVTSTAAPTSSHVHSGEESSRITASIYQATTLPASNKTTRSVVEPENIQYSSQSQYSGPGQYTGPGQYSSQSQYSNQGQYSGPGQYSSQNGSLLSGTDIRASSGSDLHHSSTKTEPTNLVSTSSATSASPYTNTSGNYSTTAPSTTSTIRPSPVHTKSVQTISDLHIPGEFPQSASSLPGSAA